MRIIVHKLPVDKAAQVTLYIILFHSVTFSILRSEFDFRTIFPTEDMPTEV